MSYLKGCLLWLILPIVATAFNTPPPRLGQPQRVPSISITIANQFSPTLALHAKKKTNKKGKTASGGGFGTKSSTNPTSSGPITADKISLERQWDTFASITDLEIKPLTTPETDPDYIDFKVVDITVRCRTTPQCVGTKWFRIGKLVTAYGTSTEAGLAAQRGLILWTAVHMRREFVALGKAGADAMEVGYISPAIVYMGSDSDGPLDDDEETYIKVAEKVPLMGVKQKSFGFRPDWNPPGFTYKRREKAAMKQKRSALEEILEDS